MEKCFTLSSNSKIILYGAASIGDLMYQALCQEQYKVIGFVDKRAYELESYKGLPVWNIEELPFENDEVVIILSVKNVFEHDDIVKKFIQNGYHNLIFKPYAELLGDGSLEQILLSETYDSILKHRLKGTYKLPRTIQIEPGINRDYGLIQREAGYVVAWVPTVFVYTNHYIKYNCKMEKWGDINLYAFFTHLNFFRYLMGMNEGNLEDYVNEYCIFTAKLQDSILITDSWKENVVNNRSMILEQMSLSYELDREFFVRSAPEAEWNEKGYFNLQSGKHRASFLAAKYNKYIPLKIKEQDYSCFINQGNIPEVAEFLGKTENLQTPILHPYFYRYPTKNREYLNILLAKTSCFIAETSYRMFGKVNFEAFHILDATHTLGEVSRHFYRMGSRAHGLLFHEEVALAQKLNKLFSCNPKFITELADEEKYQVVIWDKEISGEMPNWLKVQTDIQIYILNKDSEVQNMITCTEIYQDNCCRKICIVRECKTC